MKKLFYVVGCLLMLSSSPVMAADDPAVVVVRVFETYGKARLVIERGADKPEIIEFESGNNEKENVAAAKAYYGVITKLYQQGYMMQGAIPGASLPVRAENTSTLIFIKTPKP